MYRNQKTTYYLFYTFCLCLLLIMVGCDDKVENSTPKPPSSTPLVIGLIPEHNIFNQLERYAPLVEYISQKIGRKIKLKTLTRYGNIVDNFNSLNLDGAFFGSFTYTLAHKKLNLEVLVRPEDLKGVSTYHGLIFVRKDSGIQSVNDMKGKVFVFVDKATTAGFLLPMAMFKRNGVKDYKSYLKETYFSGTHEDAIYDVIHRKADIGAAKNTVFERLSKKDKRLLEELAILALSPKVPSNGLALKRTLNTDLKRKFKEALLNMDKNPRGQVALQQFGAKRFIETTDSDYQAVFDYAREIGLNITTYDYQND